MNGIRNTLVLALLLLVAAPAVAAPIGIHPGIKVGVAVANFTGNISDAADLKARSQMTFGGTLRFDIGGVFSLQPEIQYVPKGGKGTFVVTDDTGAALGSVDGVMKLDYLELPMLAKFKFPSGGPLAPNLYLAPSAAINLASKLQADLATVGLPAGTESKDLDNQVKKVDFGGSVGGGFDLRTGKGLLTVDARYTLGLNEIFKAASSGGIGGVSGVLDDKSRTLTLTLGYAF
jgi:hypothetical protein